MVVLEFFRLIASGKPGNARRLFAADCKHHNPFVPAGMDAYLGSIEKVQGSPASGSVPTADDSRLDIDRVLVDGDFVGVLTSYGSPKRGKLGGVRQFHLFRFKGDLIVEYWDITQQLPKRTVNADGLV